MRLRYAIDFGTSNSLVCLSRGSQVEGPLALDSDAPDPGVFRSVMYLTPKKSWFGAAAVREFLADSDPEGRLLRSFKRFLPSQNFSGTQIGSKRMMIEDMVARFLGELKSRADRLAGTSVNSVVMGRPALFSEDPSLDRLAEQRLERAAKAAGFDEIEFVPEPLAAAFGYRQRSEGESLILVADFGGGTSDFTVMRVSPSKPFERSDVLAIGGVPMAGDALDGEIMRHRVSRQFGAEVRYTTPFGSNVLTMPKGLMENLCSTAHIPLLSRRENADFLDRVRKAALGADDARTLSQLETLISDQLGFPVFEAIEACKRRLSSEEVAPVTFRYPGVSFDEPVARSEFVTYAEGTVSRILKALDDTLLKAGVKAAQISRVCCTGGTARARVLREPIEARFGREKIEEYRNFTSIVEGLAHWASA